MNIKRLFFPLSATVILVMSSAACQPAPPQAQTTSVEVTNVNDNEIVTSEITQTKFFNQCDSSSIFKTNVQFSDSSSRTNQQQLMLGAEVSGGVDVPSTVKVQISGSIEKHFSETLGQGQAHLESASIEVPARTQQEYTITWRETRHKGTVEYSEAGETKTINYSYRVGLELVSASGKDIPCQEATSLNTFSSPTPTIVPETMLSPAVKIVDQHFRIINDAVDKDDLIQSWNLMTSSFQCNPSDECQFSKFRDWWWQWHVLYEIYDCGPYTVVVRYSVAPRNQPSLISNTIYYERYDLIEGNGELKMNEGHLIDSLDNSCTPVLDSQ